MFWVCKSILAHLETMPPGRRCRAHHIALCEEDVVTELFIDKVKEEEVWKSDVILSASVGSDGMARMSGPPDATP